jgi:hypothetical protein
VEIGQRLFTLASIAILAGLQLGAWHMGFNGQLTIILTSTIVGLVMLVTGLKIDLKKS